VRKKVACSRKFTKRSETKLKILKSMSHVRRTQIKRTKRCIFRAMGILSA